MAAVRTSPETPEERIVYWAIVSTWGLWVLGAQYHVFPILGWVLAGMAVARRIGVLDDLGKEAPPLPHGVVVWAFGMLVMAIALVFGHLDFELGLPTLFKSLFGWCKGWALMVIFIYAGAELQIKPAVVFRASNILALQSLLLTPVLSVIALAGAPSVLYVSPLLYLGGPGASFFEVGSHAVDPGSLGFRLKYFAPWSPAAAFCAQIGLVCGLFDRDARWRAIGIVSALVACAMAQSRLSLIAIPVLIVGLPLLSNLTRSWPSAIASVLVTVGLMVLTQVQTIIEDAMTAFIGARADSSRVRAALSRMAYHRWETEAPLWGHGVVERGPQMVEHVSIGSHHTWHGLLFVKGAVGFLALAVPLAWSFFELLAKAQRDRTARAALGMILVFLFNSFGENLEILNYLAWPGLLVVGIATGRALKVPTVWSDMVAPYLAPHPELARGRA